LTPGTAGGSGGFLYSGCIDLKVEFWIRLWRNRRLYWLLNPSSL
jgi:hypothetical protein